jgi:hypothetical protein
MFVLAASALRAGMEAWNQTQFAEEEKSLPEDVRNRPHIITGVSEDGKVQYIDRLGVTPDFLEWFGLDAAPQLVNDYLKNRKSEKEIALEIAKSPIKKIVNGVNPFIKTPAEVLFRKQLFPDPFDPMPIRDMGDYVARQLTLSDEYRALFDIPTEGYKASLKKILVSESDPERAAYNDVVSRKYEFLKKKGKSTGFSDITPKSNALYNLKNAIRYNQPKLAAKYYLEYGSLGGGSEGLKNSIERMNPLKSFANNPVEAAEFLLYLGSDGRLKLQKAMAYWENAILSQSQDKDFNGKVRKEINKIESELK